MALRFCLLFLVVLFQFGCASSSSHRLPENMTRERIRQNTVVTADKNPLMFSGFNCQGSSPREPLGRWRRDQLVGSDIKVSLALDIKETSIEMSGKCQTVSEASGPFSASSQALILGRGAIDIAKSSKGQTQTGDLSCSVSLGKGEVPFHFVGSCLVYDGMMFERLHE